MNSEMEKDILKVLVTEEELKTRIAELGEELILLQHQKKV